MLFSKCKLPLCFAAAVLSLAGCAVDPETVALTESVTTLTESEAEGCVFVKDVYSREYSQEDAVDSLRLQAAELKADSVLVSSLQAITFPDYMFGYGLHNNGAFITVSTEFYARGRAYICNPEAKASLLLSRSLNSDKGRGAAVSAGKDESPGVKDVVAESADLSDIPAPFGSVR